jgi:molybdate transport system ATP-binding protein
VEGALTTYPTPSRGLEAEFVVGRGTDFVLDLELSIAPGQTVALLGPNGAGKSTAVRALAGISPIDRGHIALNGRPFDDPRQGLFIPPDRRKVGVVFQDYLLFPHLSVRENIAFGPRSHGVDRPTASDMARRWINRLGLDEVAERLPRELSGGQAQRVALARALVGEPDLLLLDEPLAALDVTTRSEMRRVLAEHLGQYPGPRLLITHDPTEAFLLADRVHVIENGAVTQVGTADDIRLRPRTRYAADLAGSNLFVGHAASGVIDVDGVDLHVADSSVRGRVLVTIHPRVIALHRQVPEGSPRNVWRSQVRVVERLGDRVRVQMGPPLPITAEVTRQAGDSLGLEPGVDVWVSIKATEIAAEPDQ